jgi:predicted Zn-dependent peptidase
MRLLLPFVLLSFCLAVCGTPAWAAYERLNETNPEDPMDVHIYRLENGLTVYLTALPEAPRFYAEIAVRAGSKQDPAESTGLAHYLEHLLFKGTSVFGTLDYEKEKVLLDEIEDLYEKHFHETDPQKRADLYAKINEASVKAAEYAVPNEMDRLYKAMGGQGVNAHTWHEETVYKVDLPANRVQQWAALESERFREPVFRLFQTELETVYEEMNRALDNKQRIIMRAVDDVLYPTHPYGQQPTLGKVDHLKNPSLRNIGTYFETYYVPNNMAIFISGDINVDETIATIDKYFSGWEPKDLPEPQTWDEKPLDGRKQVKVTYEGEEYVLLAFRTAGQNDEDAEALQLLDMILDNQTAGLINLNLNQQQRVRSAGSYPMQLNDYGTQYLYGIPKEGQTLQEVEQLLLDQIEHIKNGEFEDWILPAIINDFRKREKSGLEDNYSRVSEMRKSWLAFQDWDYATERLDRLAALTKEDVVRVANKYFGDAYVAGYREDAPHVVPDIEKPELAKLEINANRESDFAKKILSMPYDPIEPTFVNPETDYVKDEKDSGRTLYYSPNPVNDVFTFSFTVDFGRHEDNTISTATMLLDKSGAGDLGPEDLKKEWYKLGTDFGIATGDNETTLTLSGLDENFDESLELLQKVLTEPSATDETLATLKQIILAQREDAKKQADSITGALVQYNRYGDDSIYLRMLPQDELMALTVDELLAVIKKLPSYKHTISYTGSLPKKKVDRILKKYLPAEEDLEDPPPYRYLTVREPENQEIYFIDKDVAQATIRLEFGSMDYDEDYNTAIQLYNNYFAGGMAGIVFQELREARALAYVAGARYITGYRKGDQNLMVGLIQTQADKTIEATKAFIDLLDNLPESDQRFAVARESLLNRYRTGKIGFREVIGAVRSWERLGLDVDPRKARYEEARQADLEKILAFHKEYLKDRTKLISVVGDGEKIDLTGLGDVAEIKTIAIDDIFVD